MTAAAAGRGRHSIVVPLLRGRPVKRGATVTAEAAAHPCPVVSDRHPPLLLLPAVTPLAMPVPSGVKPEPPPPPPPPPSTNVVEPRLTLDRPPPTATTADPGAPEPAPVGSGASAGARHGAAPAATDPDGEGFARRTALTRRLDPNASQVPRIFSFWAWNSASVSAPWSRSLASLAISSAGSGCDAL